MELLPPHTGHRDSGGTNLRLVEPRTKICGAARYPFTPTPSLRRVDPSRLVQVTTKKPRPRRPGDYYLLRDRPGIWEYGGRAPTLYPKDPMKPVVHRGWFRHLGSTGPKIIVPLRQVGAFLGTTIQEAMDEERRFQE